LVAARAIQLFPDEVHAKQLSLTDFPNGMMTAGRLGFG
jgi:hypothetical protein